MHIGSDRRKFNRGRYFGDRRARQYAVVVEEPVVVIEEPSYIDLGLAVDLAADVVSAAVDVVDSVDFGGGDSGGAGASSDW